jgi:hypothetical protein
MQPNILHTIRMATLLILCRSNYIFLSFEAINAMYMLETFHIFYISFFIIFLHFLSKREVTCNTYYNPKPKYKTMHFIIVSINQSMLQVIQVSTSQNLELNFHDLAILVAFSNITLYRHILIHLVCHYDFHKCMLWVSIIIIIIILVLLNTLLTNYAHYMGHMTT